MTWRATSTGLLMLRRLTRTTTSKYLFLDFFQQDWANIWQTCTLALFETKFSWKSIVCLAFSLCPFICWDWDRRRWSLAKEETSTFVNILLSSYILQSTNVPPTETFRLTFSNLCTGSISIFYYLRFVFNDDRKTQWHSIVHGPSTMKYKKLECFFSLFDLLFDCPRLNDQVWLTLLNVWFSIWNDQIFILIFVFECLIVPFELSNPRQQLEAKRWSR